MTEKKHEGQFIPYGSACIGKEERQAIDSVLERNWWGLDTEGKMFEQELAEKMNVNNAIFVTSGSAALHLGIQAAELPKGSEVIVPACTFPTPIASLIHSGLTPVVVDIEPQTYFMDPASIEKAITPLTKAIFVVYVAGNIGNIEQIVDIAKRKNLLIFEDNCDGFGGTWNAELIGNFGLFSAISMHAAHIITTGQGGVVFTDNNEFAQKVRSLRDWGRAPQAAEDSSIGDLPEDHRRFAYTSLGGNFQPLELQAAMGRVQLRRLEEFKMKRKANVEVLQQLLDPYSDYITLPRYPKEADPCWMAYPIVLQEDIARHDFTKYLTENSIDWRPILASNIARQPAYTEHLRISGTLPNADMLVSSGLWLPINHTLNADHMQFIAKVVHKFCDQLS
jgi:CDP-6-deoxy-D-xylo-4-hexulose-3-dehydrase